MNITKFDKKDTYCRKLGHIVPFKYCRIEKQEEKLPCLKILDCWFEKIPVQNFIGEHYSKKDISYIFETSKPKITSILEFIEKAKKIK